MISWLFLNRLTDWFFFLVLDIDNPVLDQIPTGVRVINGLIQATCVRAAGFAAVPLSALAPAVKFVCIRPSFMAADFFCVGFFTSWWCISVFVRLPLTHNSFLPIWPYNTLCRSDCDEVCSRAISAFILLSSFFFKVYALQMYMKSNLLAYSMTSTMSSRKGSRLLDLEWVFGVDTLPCMLEDS